MVKAFNLRPPRLSAVKRPANVTMTEPSSRQVVCDIAVSHAHQQGALNVAQIRGNAG